MINLKKDNKVDLGCGANKKKGYIGIDCLQLKNVDFIIDITKQKLPFKDSTITNFWIHHCFEHIEYKYIRDNIMPEIYRVGKHNAKIEIHVPHFSSVMNFYEEHTTHFRYTSFKNLTENNNFKLISTYLNFDKGIFHPYNYFWEKLLNLHPKICRYWEYTPFRMFSAGELRYIFRINKKEE